MLCFRQARRPRPGLAGKLLDPGAGRWVFSGGRAREPTPTGTFRASTSATTPETAHCYARYNFSNGFFAGSQRSNMGFVQPGSELVQQFRLDVIAKACSATPSWRQSPPPCWSTRRTGIPMAAFAAFGNAAGSLPVSSVNAGIEFQPTSNPPVVRSSATSSSPGPRASMKPSIRPCCPAPRRWRSASPLLA